MDCYLFDCFSAADAERMLETILIVFPAAFASVAAVLVKREYRCRFPTQGHDMKAIISAACAAVFLLSGCEQLCGTHD
ncbi:hypothetical protein HFO13_04630 [Rhizobium leguminosarum]|nr:hypothetical protein [Rhizobium leguminosarum]